MTCNGICKQYKAKKVIGSKYKDGQKRCQECEIYLKYDGRNCPCCRCQLRTGPRSKEYKEKLRAQRGII